MLNFLINFCITTFICYAAAAPVRAILFPKKRPAGRVSAAARKAKIIRINSKKKARRNLRAAYYLITVISKGYCREPPLPLLWRLPRLCSSDGRFSPHNSYASAILKSGSLP